MALNLNDLLKKAEKKGIVQQNNSSRPLFLRSWQQESILYSSEDGKLEPNLSQSEAKLGTELEPNLSQSNRKLEPNLSQSEAKLGTELEPNLSQKAAKTDQKTSFSSLVGLQRKIVLFIHEICKTILKQQTNPISIEFIAAQCQSPKSAVRKAIQRLEQKKIILRVAFKNGRGGWTQYQLSDQISQEILMLENQKLEPK
jgi:hypothetical protein